jgi:hypothetical protein
VAGTIKALNEIRHTPASPGVLRKAQQLQQYYQQQQIQQQYNHPTPKYDTSASLIQQPPPPVITATFPYGNPNSETFSAVSCFLLLKNKLKLIFNLFFHRQRHRAHQKHHKVFMLNPNNYQILLVFVLPVLQLQVNC